MKINVINRDGGIKEIETDKISDIEALQLEKQAEIVEFCKKHKIYIMAFTMDGNLGGGAFYNLPSDHKSFNQFLDNMDEKLRNITKGQLCISIVKPEQE